MEAAENRAATIGVIGCGLIGRARLGAIRTLRDRGRRLEVVGVYDPYLRDPAAFAAEWAVRVHPRVDALLSARPDWVVIATPHDTAVDLAVTCLDDGRSVLLEKPLGRTVAEAERVVAAVRAPARLRVGFNYRFFTGVQAALLDLRAGRFGQIVSIAMELGHGCHPEIVHTWKLDPVRAGGGCLIDPGIHVLDLARLMSGDRLCVRHAERWDGFWKTGIEEECHLLFDGGGFPVNVQVSIVRWRSTFGIRINGTDGYGLVEGRNQSYGAQTYVRGRRWAWRSGLNQRDTEELVTRDANDDVFAKELEAVVFPEPRAPIAACTAEEGLATMRLYEASVRSMSMSQAEPGAG